MSVPPFSGIGLCVLHAVSLQSAMKSNVVFNSLLENHASQKLQSLQIEAAQASSEHEPAWRQTRCNEMILDILHDKELEIKKARGPRQDTPGLTSITMGFHRIVYITRCWKNTLLCLEMVFKLCRGMENPCPSLVLAFRRPS